MAWCTGPMFRVVSAVDRLRVPERGRPAQMMPSPEAKQGPREGAVVVFCGILERRWKGVVEMSCWPAINNCVGDL